MLEKIIALQAQLSKVFGPSGSEDLIAEAIASIAKPYVDEIRRDTLGNLIALKKSELPNAKKVMFSAHMDTIGLIVTHIDKDGFLWISNIGGIKVRGVSGTAVKFSSGVRGVVCQGGKADPKEPKISDLYIDIGAKDENSARALVSVGDIAVFDQPTFQMGEDLLASPYLDARIGCAALLLAMEGLESCVNDLYFVFSAQEEVGIRGAKTAAYAIAPDYGFAVDVTTAGDIPEFNPKTETKLRGGVGIKIMDRSVICSPKIVNWLEEAARREGIPHQREILRLGGTDAGAIHLAREGVMTGAISIPVRCVHNTLEICSINDVSAAVRLIKAACGVCA